MHEQVPTMTGFAEVNGTRLYYEVAGEGQPLVLLHSGLADCRMWDAQVPVFSQHHRTIRYDLRGSGRSPMPPGAYDMWADLRALLSTLGVARAHVLGLSIGGGIAVDFALAYPEMVSALIPVAAGLSGYDNSAMLTRMLAEVDEIEAQEGIDAANERELQIWVDGPRRTPDQTDSTMREQMRRWNAEAWAKEQPGTPIRLNPPAAGRLAEIRVPTLVIYGDGDQPDIIERGAYMAAQIAGAHRVVYPGVAHMVNLERPDAFAQSVLDFFATAPTT